MRDFPRSWTDFDLAVAKLLARIDRKAEWIYGVPRGGLALAVALSHAMDIPLIMQPTNGMILVDDIADSGKTIRYFRDRFAISQVVTWFHRIGCPEPVDYAAETIDIGLWVVFPWEQREVCSAAGQ
jgi:hypoxanthine phosphoribosyltransferase